MVATSIHALPAGVRIPLLETLLDYGAAIGESAVNDCLGTGAAKLREFFAKRGAKLDLEGAAGVGRLDLVRTFFHEGAPSEADNRRLRLGL